MNLLALDTSTEFLSLALQIEGRVHTRHFDAANTHSQRILPLLRALLDEAGATLRALDGIAFGAGPGSFTGLRIGCGVAQGLAFGADLPVVGINTLLALAEASGHSRVVSCLDARMGEIYLAAYQRTAAGWEECCAPGLYRPETAPLPQGAGWVGAGNGWAVHQDALMARYQGLVEQRLPDVFPHARAMLALAQARFAAGDGRPAAQAAPIYLRNRVALKTSERAAGLKLH